MANQNLENSPVTAQNPTQVKNETPSVIRIPSKSKGVNPSTVSTMSKKQLAAEQAARNSLLEGVNQLEQEKNIRVTTSGGGGTIGVSNSYVDNPYGADYFKNRWMGIAFDPVNNVGGNYVSGANPFVDNYDFEHSRRQDQGTLAATGNLLTQFVAKTAVNTVGGVVAGFYGIGSAIANGDSTKLYDNSVTRGLDDATKWVDENNSVFTSEYARSQQGALNIFNVEGAKNLGDGMSFVTGAVLAEIVTGALTGGIGNAIKATSLGLKMANGLAKSGRMTTAGLGKVMSKIGSETNSLRKHGQAITRASEMAEELVKTNRLTNADEIAKVLGKGSTAGMVEDIAKFQTSYNSLLGLGVGARKIVTGTMWESGLEARQAKDEFIENNLQKTRDEIYAREDISDVEKERLAKQKENEIRTMADNVGMGVFTLNAVVLQASNMVQFPQLFGFMKKANPDKYKSGFSLNPMKTFDKIFKQSGQGLGDDMYQLTKMAKAKAITRTFGRILKNPITEGLEEMSQAAVSDLVTDYYQDRLSTEYQIDEMNQHYSSFASEFADNLAGAALRTGNQLADTFTDEESYKEGVIGAVMGALGAPIFKKNKNGKLRPAMAGGVYQDYKTHRQGVSERKDALAALNSQRDDLTSLLGFNQENAVMMEKLRKKNELADLTQDERQRLENHEQGIANYTLRMKKLGLGGQMNETYEDIRNMSLDEYKTSFNKDESFTQEDKDNDLKEFKESMDRYSNAYDLVYKNLNLDMINEDSNLSRMTDVLVNAIGYEKFALQQENVIVDKLYKSGVLDTLGLSKDDVSKLTAASSEVSEVRKGYHKVIAELTEKQRQEYQSSISKSDADSANYISSLDESFRPHAKKLTEAIKNGDAVAEQNAINALNALISTSSTIDSNTIINTINNISRNSVESKKMLDLISNEEKLEEWAISNDPEKVADAKKAIEEVSKVVADRIEKDDAINRAKFLEKDNKVKKDVTPNALLKAIETSARFRAIEKALKEQNEKSDLASFIENESEYFSLLNFRNEMLTFANKRLAAVTLAKGMLQMGGMNAYNSIQIDSYNYGIQELSSSMVELKMALNDNDENEMVLLASRVRMILDKLATKKQSLIDSGAVTAEQFEQKDGPINRAESLLKIVNTTIDMSELDSVAKEEAAKEEAEKVKVSELGGTDGLTLEMNTPKIVTPDTTGGKEIISEPTDEVDLETDDDTEIEDELEDEVDDSGNKTGEKVKRKKSDIIKEVANEFAKIKTENAKPSVLFTMNASTATGNNRDIGSDINDEKATLRYKIDNGIIRYNQTIQMDANFSIEDLSGESLASFEKAAFGVEGDNDNKTLYLKGSELLNGPGGRELLNLPMEKMPHAVKYFIARTRIVQSFYDKAVKAYSGSQISEVSDTDNPIHSMYLYAATLEHDPKEIKESHEAYLANYRKIEVDYLDSIAKVRADDSNTDLEKDMILSSIRENYETQLENLNKAFESSISGKNDYANFNLRVKAIKDKMDGKKTFLRVANFTNGTIATEAKVGYKADAGGAMIKVPTHPLIATTDDPNGLFNNSDPFSLDKLAYVDNSGTLYNFESNDVVKLNDGSLVEKNYLSSGAIYAIITTVNGQKIPVKLNTERIGLLDNSEEMIAEIDFIIREYLKLETSKDSPNETVVLPENTMFEYAKGMTYKNFFASFARSQKAAVTSLSATIGGFINFNGGDGQLHIGEEIILNNSSTEEQIVKFKDVIVNTRMFFNRKILKNSEGEVNQKYLDFFVNNGYLNHTVPTASDSVHDRIFERDANKTVAIQVHVLNDGEVNQPAVKESSYIRKRKAVYQLMFGSTTIDEDRMNTEHNTSYLINGVNKAIAGRLTARLVKEPNMSDSDKVKQLNEVVESVVIDKLLQMKNVLLADPTQITKYLIDILSKGDSLDKLRGIKEPKNGTLLDHYMYILITTATKVNGSAEMANAYIKYAGNINLSTKFRKMLIKSEAVTKIGNVVGHKKTSKNTRADGSNINYYEYEMGIFEDASNNLIARSASEISAANKAIDDAEYALSKAKSDEDKAKAQSDLDKANSKKKEVVENRKKIYTDLFSHMMLVTQVLGTIYNVESSFGADFENFPNFQFNHTKMSFGKSKTNRYHITESGEVALSSDSKDGDHVLENGSLIVNKNTKGIKFSLMKLDSKGQPIKENDKNTYEIMTGRQDISKITFDENGNPLGLKVVIPMAKKLSSAKAKEAKAFNDKLTADRKKAKESGNTKEIEKLKNVFYKNTKFEYEDVLLFKSNDTAGVDLNALSEFSLPGINSDASINNDTKIELESIIDTFTENSKLFKPVPVNKAIEVVDPMSSFGTMPNRPESKTSSEVAVENKKATLPIDPMFDDLVKAMAKVNAEKPKPEVVNANDIATEVTQNSDGSISFSVIKGFQPSTGESLKDIARKESGSFNDNVEDSFPNDNLPNSKPVAEVAKEVVTETPIEVSFDNELKSFKSQLNEVKGTSFLMSDVIESLVDKWRNQSSKPIKSYAISFVDAIPSEDLSAEEYQELRNILITFLLKQGVINNNDEICKQ